jgi:hypothetical protein
MTDTFAAEQALRDFAAAGWVRVGSASEAEERQVLAAAQRRYWSGPSRIEREIMVSFGITHQDITLLPRSVLDGRYRIRQRNRRRRR